MTHALTDLPALAKNLIPVAEEAGREIMRIYRGSEWSVSEKLDKSPLTQADLAANAILLKGIAQHSRVTIISEEDAGHSAPAQEEFWLVDPLDGTRDFVAKLDTFVVCIALVQNSKPVLGLIHAPVTGETWWAAQGHGCHGPRGIVLNREARSTLIAAGSRSMPSDRMQQFYDHFKIQEIVRFGSALKFCKLAEGDFDLYPRFGPTHEWDTAAGQIIAEEAGCKVVSIRTNDPIEYGKPGYLNSGFIASRNDLDIVSELRAKGLVPQPPKG